jgi:hypothetical protein
MTNYYIGYIQGNDEYVFVGNITPTNVGISTTTNTALTFDNEELAKGVLAYVETMIANQDFKVVKITTVIEEIDNEESVNTTNGEIIQDLQGDTVFVDYVEEDK